MTNREILRMLAESQALLNQATETEERKRIRTTGSDLERELAGLAESARGAHAQASEQMHDLEEILQNARSGVDALMAADKGRGRREDNSIYEQINEAVDGMATAQQEALEEIEYNLGRLGAFNITLFGRTLSGKSTLMEILTRGNGGSIGKGAQRTTRDVREYHWNGMRITDIPGVAAFGGEADEDIAYEAARQADLIIFLITDDEAQATEAEHFVMLRKTGNPMLGICNVKRAVGDDSQIKLFLMDQNDLFDEKWLHAITDQFNEMVASHGPGIKTDFKHAHLQSRFLANQPEHQSLRSELTSASRFSDIEDHITGEVSKNGRFHRRRSFLESAHRATFSIWRQMLATKKNSYDLHDRLRDHAQETRSWKGQFQKDAQARIQSAINNTIGKLRNDIPSFAEDHCEDSEINTAWRLKVESIGINGRAREVQEQLQEQVRGKIRTLVEEIDYELITAQARFGTTTIHAGYIRDHKRIWNRTVTGVTSAIGTAAAAAFFTFPPLAVPLGIASVAVKLIGSFLSKLIGDRAQRRQEATAKIRTDLEENLDQIEGQLKRDMDKYFRADLVETQINGTIHTLETLQESANQAAKFYHAQADALRENVLDMNKQMVTYALEREGNDTSLLDLITIARAPGQGMAVRARNDAALTKDNIRAIQEAVQEPVEVIPSLWSDRRVIQWAIDLEGADEIDIDQRRGTAQVKHATRSPETPARTIMAEQITGLNIINTG